MPKICIISHFGQAMRKRKLKFKYFLVDLHSQHVDSSEPVRGNPRSVLRGHDQAVPGEIVRDLAAACFCNRFVFLANPEL